MTELTDFYTTELDGWLFKVRTSRGEGRQRLLTLIHGWTGDENVMSIFARRIPDDYYLVFPRGPIEAPSGGFGWLDRQDRNHSYDAYQQIAEQLWNRLTVWRQENDLMGLPVHLMGFSQGAAMCYTLSVEYPEEIGRVAALAGYLPDGLQARLDPGGLTGKEFFIAHGSQDPTVPISRGREAATVMESAGAKVTFCEDDVGHKISAGCFRGLEEFFA